MRPSFILFFMLAAGATACAARAPISTLSRYSCGAGQLVRTGDNLAGPHDAVHVALGWRDDAGSHFVSPSSPNAVQAVEYVVPQDERADAIHRIYDSSRGMARAEWPLVSERTCTAERGYTAALSSFAKGASMDQVASELSLSGRDEARGLVHDALINLSRRYYKDR